MQQRARTTGKKPTECPNCDGFGDTSATRTAILPDLDPFIEHQLTEEIVTTAQGSGCPRCLGVGQLGVKRVD